MITDPIADLLTRIRNAIAVRKESLRVPYSRMNYSIATVLLRRGYLARVERRGRRESRSLEVYPRYLEDGTPVIQGIMRISRPGRRVYQKISELRPWRQGAGFVVLSTPQGILTHREARVRKVGGEALLAVW